MIMIELTKELLRVIYMSDPLDGYVPVRGGYASYDRSTDTLSVRDAVGREGLSVTCDNVDRAVRTAIAYIHGN